MFIRKKTLPLVCPLLFGIAASFLPAAEKLDFDRITPVPESETVPVMDFFRPAILNGPKLNPAGTHIAAIVSTDDDHTRLMVYDLATKQIETLSTRGDSDVDWVTWLNDDRLVFGISVKKMSSFILGAGEVGELYNSYPLLQNVGASLIAVPPKDRLHPLARLNPNTMNTGKYGEVVTVNAQIASGKLLDLSGNGALLSAKALDDSAEINVRHITVRHPILETPPDGFDLGYLADKEGRLAFGETSVDGVFSLYRLAGEKWEKCPEDLDEINVLGTGDNPGEIVVLGPRRDGQPRALEVMDAATGKVVEVLVQDKAYDFNGWLYRDPTSHDIVGAIYTRDGPHVVWFTEAYRNLQKLVNGLFPGQVVRILGTDDGGKMVLLSAFSDRQPPVYSWVDLGKHTTGLIKNSAPWIDPKRMRPVSIIKFKTLDGRQLDAYVTMPAGASKQNPPPLVVLPHANQWGRDSWGYHAEAQFLASRGYAVLQPNYRGSAGYTGLFPEEDEWAFHKMHDDVTAATKALISSGLVDSNRVAIVGTSFGGFLALSGVAYEPGLYRCAVAISAVYDWGRMIANYKHDEYSDPYYARMVRKLGDPKKDPAKWDAIAPLRHADQIRVPVFLARGEYDASVNISESKDLASALERNHVPVESVSFVNESDGVHHLGHQVELYTRIEAFLAKYLMPANAAGSP